MVGKDCHIVTRLPHRCKARSLAAGATQSSHFSSKVPTKRCGPGQTRRLTGTAFGRVIVTGGLIRRRRNLGPLCYVAVTVGLIHRPAGTVEKPLAIGFPLTKQIPAPVPIGSSLNRASEQLAIDDKTGILRHLVVELARGAVGLVRLPVDAR